MNNLLFEKIWEDADFYQIMVKALAKNISAEKYMSQKKT